MKVFWAKSRAEHLQAYSTGSLVTAPTIFDFDDLSNDKITA